MSGTGIVRSTLNPGAKVFTPRAQTVIKAEPIFACIGPECFPYYYTSLPVVTAPTPLPAPLPLVVHSPVPKPALQSAWWSLGDDEDEDDEDSIYRYTTSFGRDSGDESDGDASESSDEGSSGSSRWAPSLETVEEVPELDEDDWSRWGANGSEECDSLSSQCATPLTSSSEVGYFTSPETSNTSIPLFVLTPPTPEPADLQSDGYELPRTVNGFQGRQLEYGHSGIQTSPSSHALASYPSPASLSRDSPSSPTSHSAPPPQEKEYHSSPASAPVEHYYIYYGCSGQLIDPATEHPQPKSDVEIIMPVEPVGEEPWVGWEPAMRDEGYGSTYRSDVLAQEVLRGMLARAMSYQYTSLPPVNRSRHAGRVPSQAVAIKPARR